jgi:hypothetical protein
MISFRRRGAARYAVDRRARHLHRTFLAAVVLLLLPALAIAVSRTPESELAADASPADDLTEADLTAVENPKLDAAIESSVLPFDAIARSGRTDPAFVRNPEPTVGVLSGLGLLGLAARRYRQA